MFRDDKNLRYEFKYILSQSSYDYIFNWIKLSEFNFNEEYPERKINNIYFDNYNYDCYKSNIEGLSYRVKLRLRWYNDLHKIENPNLEIKYKKNFLGWKSKLKIKNYTIKEKLDIKDITSHIYNSIDSKSKVLFESYSFPIILNTYKRNYFISFDKKIRITLDREHKVFDLRNNSKINLMHSYLMPKNIIMEIKFEKKLKKIANSLLKNIPVRQSKNSKYINSLRTVSGI